MTVLVSLEPYIECRDQVNCEIKNFVETNDKRVQSDFLVYILSKGIFRIKNRDFTEGKRRVYEPQHAPQTIQRQGFSELISHEQATTCPWSGLLNDAFDHRFLRPL